MQLGNILLNSTESNWSGCSKGIALRQKVGQALGQLLLQIARARPWQDPTEGMTGYASSAILRFRSMRYRCQLD